ncbi:MAG: hypothetical protein HY506_02040 [Candidatus Yanofskybacteria bacterium]|nr:hypothetical protein [Candidatus Yanofskybacteria bacterium]
MKTDFNQNISGPIPRSPVVPRGNEPTKVLPNKETPTPQFFKSSIRTMQEDILALQKGEQPSGAKLEKESEIATKPAANIQGPKITPPPPQAQLKTELGRLEKSKSFGLVGGAVIEPRQGEEKKTSRFSFLGLGKLKNITTPTTSPILPPTQAAAPGLQQLNGALNIPDKEGAFNRFSNIAVNLGGKRRTIFIAIGGVAVLGLAIFWVFRNDYDPGDVTFSPTPQITQTVSPTPAQQSQIDEYFTFTGTFDLGLDSNFLTVLSTHVANELVREGLSNSGQPALYILRSADGTIRHGFKNVMDNLLIKPPVGIYNSLSDQDLYFSTFYKIDGTVGYGFIVKINDINGVRNSLSTWETSMTNDLSQFFKLKTQEAASIVFLDNTYNDTAIRYRNFSEPELTIDYAVVAARNGNNYLVFTNSRDHIYSIIDKIK